MTRLLCRLRGHKWEYAWRPGWRDKGLPAMFCTRCRENGWLMK